MAHLKGHETPDYFFWDFRRVFVLYIIEDNVKACSHQAR